MPEFCGRLFWAAPMSYVVIISVDIVTSCYIQLYILPTDCTIVTLNFVIVRFNDRFVS